MKVFLEQHGDQVSGSTVIIDRPETDCVNAVLYKYSQIKSLLNGKRIRLYCKLHDQLTEKSTKKVKASKKRKTIDEKSVTKEEFYLGFEMLGQLIRDYPSYASIKLPHENMGALSIRTGNDKVPAFRSCTKDLAFTQFKKQAELRNAMSLVNPASKIFENHEHCIAAYRQLILIMYYHIYRTTIRKLGLTWESFKSNEITNLDLLREVGVRHSKGK